MGGEGIHDQHQFLSCRIMDIDQLTDEMGKSLGSYDAGSL